jgi:hypothetical protein
MNTISPRITAADFAVFHVLRRGLYGGLASPLECCDGNWQMLTSFVSAIAVVYIVALTWLVESAKGIGWRCEGDITISGGGCL